MTDKLDLVSYPFVTDDGTIARLYLPTTLTTNDVERIAKMIRALVMTPDQTK